MSWLNNYWYGSRRPLWWWLLLPASWCYGFIIFIRKLAYRWRIFKSHKISVPVIVVGNITVGGVGKSPLCAAILEHLRAKGFNPGLISRGYKGKAKTWPQIVTENSDPALVGDEPVMLAKMTRCPIVVGPNRVTSAKLLTEQFAVDIIVSDDGLQHYALSRDLEIAVVDGKRGYGNGQLLPFGPLRELKRRLKSVDLLVVNNAEMANGYTMTLEAAHLQNLQNLNLIAPIESFREKKIHAFAAIGHPEQFFATLKDKGLTIIENPLPDHYHYQRNDFAYLDKSQTIIVTAKDAVKLQAIADDRFWVLPVHAKMETGFWQTLDVRIASLS